MEKFFEKYPLKLSERKAMRMILYKMKEALEKHKKKDEEYAKDMETCYEMLLTFLQEKQV